MQTRAINNFISYKYGFTPSSSYKRYVGDQVLESLQNDLYKHLVKLFNDKENGPAIIEDICEVHFPNWLKSFDANLESSNLFLINDSLTLYDFEIGGFFLNTVLNPNSPYKEFWDKSMKKHASQKVLNYISNFELEMKDYLDSRPESKMGY